MALVTCPECGVEASDRALACPHCAYPIARAAPTRAPHTAPAASRVEAAPPAPGAGSTLQVLHQIIGRLALGGVFFASGVAWEAPPVILGSFVVLGSAVPIWWRARRAERLGTGSVQALEDRVARRMAEAEDRSQQNLAEIEANARQIAELEERLDFTERLLTRQREQS